jgi:sugar O-acyltransferase (sialic acid O-acetyltransferase NeuD family)
LSNETTAEANNRPAIIVGGGGHARVLRDLLVSNGIPLVGLVLQQGERDWPDVHTVGTDRWLKSPAARGHDIYLGMGLIPGGGRHKERLFKLAASLDLSMPSAVHALAYIASSATLLRGCQVMAGAVVQAGAVVEEGALINTGATVDHDCRIGAHSHVAPGVTLCGDVHVGVGATVGAGAVVIPGIRIGDRAQVAAGSTVIRDIPPGVRFIPGKPLRPIEE